MMDSSVSASSEALPCLLSTATLISARAYEIAQLAKEIKAPGRQNKRSFQKLLKHERRRAQSHNPYRIPRSYRAGVLKEFETAIPNVSKRPSKDRRRRRNLLRIYLCRGKTNKCWLPDTHLWHAKRFHMENLWNFRLAVESCEKKKRQIYRHAQRKVTIHDRSYIRLFELNGTFEDLLFLFRCLTISKDFEYFQQPLMLHGSFRGTLSIYKYNDDIKVLNSDDEIASRQHLIAPIQFLWRWCEMASTNSKRFLWIWCHPSASHELYCEFQRVLQKNDQQCSSIVIKEHKTMDCFELSGREALSKLMDTFVCVNNFVTKEKRKLFSISQQLWKELKMCHNQNPPIPHGAVIPLFVRSPEILGPFPPRSKNITFFHQNETTITLPSILSSWPTIPLGQASKLVFDATAACTSLKRHPIIKLIGVQRSRKRKDIKSILQRLKDTQEKIRLLRENPSTSSLDSFQHNPLLDDDDDDTHNRKKKELTTYEESKLQTTTSKSKTSALSLPQHHPKRSNSNYKNSTEPIPVLIVRRSDAKCYSGYDVILPSGIHSTFLWNLLTRRKCNGIGVYDRHKLMTESSLPEFPWDFPECKAGEAHLYNIGRCLHKEYLKRPPSKRINYNLLNIPFPFYSNWKILINSRRYLISNPLLLPSTESLSSATRKAKELLSSFSVLRNQGPFYMEEMKSLSTKNDLNDFILKLLQTSKFTTSIRNAILLSLPKIPSIHFPLLLEKILTSPSLKHWFLPVCIASMSKGVPAERTHLYKMKKKQIDTLIKPLTVTPCKIKENNDIKFQTTLTQFVHIWDLNKNSMKPTEMSCDKLKLSVQRQPAFKSKNIRKNPIQLENCCDELGQCTSHFLQKKEENLTLTGFVTSGHHSLMKGHGFGIGYIKAVDFFQSYIHLVSSLPRNISKPFKITSIYDIISSLYVPFWFRSLNSHCYELCWVSLQV